MYPMRRNTDLGWGWTIAIVILAIAATWFIAHGRGPNACPWPAGDHRNPTGCVVRVTTTETATVTVTQGR